MPRFYMLETENEGVLHEEVEYGIINGYLFGDRLLEDVMFRVGVSRDRSDVEVSISPDSANYFKNLNEKKWLAEAKKYALKNDIFETDGELDAVLYDIDKAFDQQTAHYEEEPARVKEIKAQIKATDIRIQMIPRDQ